MYKLDRTGWMIYAILRNDGLKEKAKKYKADYLRIPDRGENIWKLVHADYDGGMLEKTFVPQHLSDEEWQEASENIWMDWYNPYEDGRDCTGVRFTRWLDRYEVPNGTWIYHRTVIDC